jgi:septum formation protein
MSYHLFLASKSPRRKAYLTELGVNFDQVNPEVDESPKKHESCVDYVLRVARDKAKAATDLLSNNKAAVIAADTAIEFQREIIGKPKGFEDFLDIFKQLSGQTHLVHSAVVIQANNNVFSTTTTTKVTFREISLDEAEQYWHSGEPQDKAAGYAIQGLGAKFVRRIEGSYSGVVGLPLCETIELLEQLKSNPE